MTSDDRLIELLGRANPVPDPNAAAAPTGGAYLRRLEQRSNVMNLSVIDPERTDQQPADPERRRPWLLVAVAAAVVAVVAGLVVIVSRPADDTVPADQPTVPTPTTTDPPAPVGRLNTGAVLEAGETYRTSSDPARGMRPTIEITMPTDQGDTPWSVLNALPLEVTFLPTGDWMGGGREPTFGLAPVTVGVGPVEAVASVEAYAAANDYEFAVEEAEIAGKTVMVVRGRDTRGSGDDLRIPTDATAGTLEQATSGFVVPPGRAFVVYFIDGPTQVIAAKIESSVANLDATIERVVPILDTIEFP